MAKKIPGKKSLEVFIFGHIGDGNLHINYLKPAAMDADDFFKACEILDREMFVILQTYRGSVSAEHGIGLMKKNLLRFSRTEKEMELFRGLKTLFDPLGILNPGKIF